MTSLTEEQAGHFRRSIYKLGIVGTLEFLIQDQYMERLYPRATESIEEAISELQRTVENINGQ